MEFARFRFALVYLRRHALGLTVVTLVSLASTALSLAQPYLTKLLIDEALLRKDTTALWNVAALMVLASVLGFAFNLAAGYSYTRIAAQVLFAMRSDLLQHLHRLSPRFYASWKTGDILSRMNNDISEIQRVVSDALLSVLSNVAFLAGSVFILVRMDVGLFGIGVAALPLAVAVAWWFRSILVDRVRVLREQSAEIGSFLLNTLLGHRIIVAYDAVAKEAAAFARRNDHYIAALLRMQLASYAGSGLPGMLLAVSTAAVFWYGGNRVIEGSMSVGTLVAFLAYHMRLLAPVQALMGLYTNLVTAQVSLERVEVLFRNAPEVAEAAEVAVPTVIRGELELCAVGFTFDERKRMLDGVTWRVGPGQTGLILGPSGAGKSTLADLLVRFYDPQAGMVQLDGVDLRRWPLAKLRETVAVVEQTPWLFPCSVGENLRYGRAEATDEELRQVLRAVGLDETFGNLQAEVGERGLAVSVGQRQRLAIARALLRRPTVLVLDEPTAALDEASEELVTRGIRGWLPHATLVLITHRLKLRGLADTVLEIA